MNPERWLEIERIYNAVLEIEPGERQAFLEKACAGDDSLRKEVERLLAKQSAAGSFIESPALEVAAQDYAISLGFSTEPAENLVGKTLQQFRIMEKIGAGGMGVVGHVKTYFSGRAPAHSLSPVAAR